MAGALMPFFENLGARIYWEGEGDGAPLRWYVRLGWDGGGGRGGVGTEKEGVEVLMGRGQDADQFAKAISPFIYDRGTPPERMEEDTSARRKWYPSADAYFAQLQAVMAWEAYGRLEQIAAPTLVIHGENDRLVPAENAKRIAAKIPGAKLVVIPRASHIFNTDQPDAAHSAILQFLDAQATRKREQPAAIPETR